MWRRCCAGEVRLYAGVRISAEYLIVFVQSVGVFHHHDVDAARTGTEGNFRRRAYGAPQVRHRHRIRQTRGAPPRLSRGRYIAVDAYRRAEISLDIGHAGGLRKLSSVTPWKYIDTGMSPLSSFKFRLGTLISTAYVPWQGDRGL